MQYGDRHCHRPTPPSPSGTIISVPIHQEDCCDELRKALSEAMKAISRLEKKAAELEKFKALLESMPAGAIVSNGATPAKLKGLNMADLAKALQPFLSRDRFFDPFGNEISSSPGNP